MVIVSSGFNRTHVTIAAREASRSGLLAGAVTGAYPTPTVRRALRALGLEKSGRLARLLERDERIPSGQMRALHVPELLDELARLLTRVPGMEGFYAPLDAACMRLYGRLAAREVDRLASRARLFHFRAGFGHASLRRANDLGLFTLCDHSAVHPLLVDRILAADGDLLAAVETGDGPTRLHPLWQSMLDDIDQTDALLVNSDFLKEMLVALGWPADRVHVIYLGIDDYFLEQIPQPKQPIARKGPLRLMFAGRLEQAKGADALIAACRTLDGFDWELVVAGPVAGGVKAHQGPFLADPRVTSLGTVSRAKLAERLSAADVFVFPSLAEGSARAVFEALACGCYVITTPNSGSIVEDGVHGALVPAGDGRALAGAITRANADRDAIQEVGRHNAALIAASYRQSDYGAALTSLYRRLGASQGDP
ncbi:MAG: glycosyltransferase family 4 protein [Solirubrobacteraceae bacterium]